MYADPMVLLLYRVRRRIGPLAIGDVMRSLYKELLEALSTDCDIRCGSETGIVAGELKLKSTL